MKDLSATLLAAQKKPDRLPYVEAKVYDFKQGIKRLEWIRLYTGSEADNHHGIAFDGQGSMHRIRVDTGSNLYRQKITSPDDQSDYSNWSLITDNCFGPCAIAAYGARIYIFYRTTANVLWKYYSHNYGQDWSNAQLVSYADVLSMAAAWWSTGNIVVCFALRYSISFDHDELTAFVLNTSDQSVTSHLTGSITWLTTHGIGACYEPDHINVIFSMLKESDPYNYYGLWRTQFDNTHHFSNEECFHLSPQGEGITYEYPDCHKPASAADYENTQLTAVEKYTGITAYTLPLTCHAVRGSAFSSMAFTEPKPFINVTSHYGLRITSSPTHWWLERPDGVWRSPRPAGTPLDLTLDIIELIQRCHSERSEESLTITLDNSRAQYATPPAKRSEVVLKLGYRTSPPTWEAAAPYAEGDIIVPTAGKGTGFFYECTTAGTSDVSEPTWPTVLGETVVDNTVVWTCHPPNEAVEVGRYWIESSEYSSTPNTSLFTIHCLDGQGLASRWSARFQMRWPATKRVWEIIQEIICRWGINLTSPAGIPTSSAVQHLYPDFTLQPGTRGDAALRRVLAFIPDALIFDGNEAYVKDLRANEDSSYSYGTDHVILQGEYAEAVPLTRARAIGRDDEDNRIVEDAFDWDLLALGIDILQQDYDPNLQSATRTQERADAILRKNALESQGGQITIPVNCGQELYDVITITDERCGISSKKYRVIDIQTVLTLRQWQYQQTLTLGAP